MTKKLVCLFMTLIFTLSLVAVSFTQASAKTTKGTTKYKIVTINKTKKYDNGIKIIRYYKKVVLKGSSKSIKKINKVFNKDCQKYMNNELIKRNDESLGSLPSGINDTYRSTHTSKMRYNKKNIVSVSVSSYWYAGGVINTDIYGFTYNVKNGKKLTLKNVCKGNEKKLKSEIIKKLKKKYGKYLFSDYKKYVKNVYKLPFYITSNNKCVIAFAPYTVKAGGTYSTVTVASKYK